MKRIYLTLGLLGFFATGAFAQLADLGSMVEMQDNTCLNAGDQIYPYDTTVNGNAQPVGDWVIINYGPDAIDSGAVVLFINPTCTLSPNGMSVKAYYTGGAMADSVLFAQSYLPTDSINSLLDINAFEDNTPDSFFSDIIVPRENLVEGQTYGFYLYTIGIGEDPNAPDNTDTVNSNTWDYVAIKWHCVTGINEMLNEASRNINVFPNPAQNVLNFKYGFIKSTAHSTARVVDMAGRIILSKELGQHSFGTQTFNMDISSLPAGNYLLELSTDYVNAVSKFTVKR